MEEILLHAFKYDPLIVSVCQGPNNKAIMDYPFTPLHVVAEIIRNPKYLKGITDEIRKYVDDKAKRDILKASLPYFTFGCQSHYRKTEYVLRPTGLCMLDIDKLASFELAEDLKKTLAQDADLDPKLIYISPSGRGVKALINRPLNPTMTIVEAQRNNQQMVNHVFNHRYAAKYGVYADDSGSDLVRSCSICHDNNVIFKY